MAVAFAVQAKHQSAVIVIGLVTFIAAYRYLMIFNSWVDARRCMAWLLFDSATTTNNKNNNNNNNNNKQQQQ